MLPGKKRFVMGASGHIAGVINPPQKNKRSHWIRADGKLPKTFNAWFEGADEHAGQLVDRTGPPGWRSQAGKQIAAPKKYGKGKYKAIEAAPGRYVKASITP